MRSIFLYWLLYREVVVNAMLHNFMYCIKRKKVPHVIVGKFASYHCYWRTLIRNLRCPDFFINNTHSSVDLTNGHMINSWNKSPMRPHSGASKRRNNSKQQIDTMYRVQYTAKKKEKTLAFINEIRSTLTCLRDFG